MSDTREAFKQNAGVTIVDQIAEELRRFNPDAGEAKVLRTTAKLLAIVLTCTGEELP
jgi:hypothetical protein